jgi:two-component system chemotaxis sensor kinase CheA
MDEFIEQFLLESRELVEQASADLLALEENPGDTERLDSAFRAFHTLKGSAAIVDFAAMAAAAHAVEDILVRVRKGQVVVSRGLISDCLAFLNIVTQWLDAMAAQGAVPQDASVAGQAFIASIGHHGAAPAKAQPLIGEISNTARALLDAQLALLSQQADVPAGNLLSAGAVAANVLAAVGRGAEAANLRRLTGEAAASGEAAPLVQAIEVVLRVGAAPVSGATESAARVLRVDVTRVDEIVRLTGELTVAKNAIGHAARLAREEGDPQALAMMLRDQHAAISRLIGELQRSVLSIRVLPLRFVFQRFPRLIRDTAETLGKAVKLEIVGEDTEADKVIVENLFEPLLHILRNALDHGIETPQERAAAGKPAVAVLRLQAGRAGDHVIVDVTDDGRGVDFSAIRRIARERGLVDADTLDAMDEAEAINLIFAPGFSTAAMVTDLSGRGVGMNAVRSAVEKLGGSVQVASALGEGTTVTLKLPFSILMTRVMTVQTGGQTFGIPFDSIVETARVPRDRISAVGAARAFVLRDRTIPVIDLGRSLGTGFATAGGPEANLVIVSLGGQLGSVEVDRLGERMDVMLRPPDGLLTGVSGVAGTSLLGDGGVLIVLDLLELLE